MSGGRALVAAGLPEGWTPLHDAVLRDDHPGAEALLGEGADAQAAIRTFGVWEWTDRIETVVFHPASTPMHVAAGLGHAAMMARLLRAGADPNAPDSFGATPLHLAASEGHVEAIRWLLEHGVALDRVTSFAIGMSRHEQMTALHAALEAGSLAACELLVAAGLSLTHRTPYGRGALFFAARGGSVEVLEYLVRKGTAPDEAGAYRNHPLHEAVKARHHAFAERLLALGADPERDNQNAMREALFWDDTRMRDIFLAAGAKPTPWETLADAAHGNDIVAVKAMLAAGVDTKHRYILKAVEAAALFGRHAAIEALLAAGIGPEGTAEARRPLHVVFEQDVLSLVEVGADLTPYLRSARLLVEAGARLDVRDSRGNTPLVLLMRWDDAELCIEAMIARGANPYERMADGTSAMSLAKTHWPSRVALLEKTAHRDEADEGR